MINNINIIIIVIIIIYIVTIIIIIIIIIITIIIIIIIIIVIIIIIIISLLLLLLSLILYNSTRFEVIYIVWQFWGYVAPTHWFNSITHSRSQFSLGMMQKNILRDIRLALKNQVVHNSVTVIPTSTGSNWNKTFSICPYSKVRRLLWIERIPPFNFLTL